MLSRALAWGGVFWFAAAAVVAMAAVHVRHSPTVLQRRQLAAREAKLRAEVRHLWLRGVCLERTRDALRSDPLMIEWIARSRLGYGRPNEEVYAPSASRTNARRVFTTRPRPAPSLTPRLYQIAKEAVIPTLTLLAASMALMLLVVNFSGRPAPALETATQAQA